MAFPITISRECGHVMRGLAITAIALHNFCHWIPGAVLQNESEFLAGNVERLAAVDCRTWQGVFDIISYFGWYGVPVFVFLTGLGLVMKYERDRAPFAPGGFLKSNWLKLVNLMLPGVVAFIVTNTVVAMLSGYIGASWSVRFLFQLTMLPDLIFPWYGPVPGVYWYFGLTLQLYIIYAFAVHGRRASWLAILVTVSLGLQWAFAPDSWVLTWIRHNATGWMTVFVFGILWARRSSVSAVTAIAIAVVALATFYPSALDPYAWQLSILDVVVILFLLARLSLRIPVWREVWIWVGRLSPFIFVAHPLVRAWIFAADESLTPSWWLLPAYFASVIITSIAYRYGWRYSSRLLTCRLGASSKGGPQGGSLQAP